MTNTIKAVSFASRSSASTASTASARTSGTTHVTRSRNKEQTSRGYSPQQEQEHQQEEDEVDFNFEDEDNDSNDPAKLIDFRTPDHDSDDEFNDPNFDDADDDDEDLPEASKVTRKRTHSQMQGSSSKKGKVVTPPELRKWADALNLGDEALSFLIEQFNATIEIENEVPSTSDLLSWARDWSIWEASRKTKQEIHKLMDKIKSLEEELKRLNDAVEAAETLSKPDRSALAKMVAFGFYSEHIVRYSASDKSLFERTMQKFIKANPLQVSDHFKKLMEDATVRDKIVAPAIHKSLGVDENSTKLNLHRLWKWLCEGYDVPFTKARAMRLVQLRRIAVEHNPRHKDGKMKGDFWKVVDNSLKEFKVLQDEDAQEAKKQLQGCWEEDKKEFGAFEDSDLSSAGAKDDALKAALR
ncbi:hypothetical protein OC844_005338 [Tilletia horrida]|nr:hypothetical protein OC844_005338 [Tilletia horrida]